MTFTPEQLNQVKAFISAMPEPDYEFFPDGEGGYLSPAQLIEEIDKDTPLGIEIVEVTLEMMERGQKAAAPAPLL